MTSGGLIAVCVEKAGYALRGRKGKEMQKDITDGIEAFAALYMDGQDDDGEVAGVYSTRTQAELSHRGEGVKIIRLVPAEPVIIHG